MKLRYKIGGGILGFLAVVIVVLAITLSYTSDCGPAPIVSGDAELMQAVEYRCYGSPDVLELTNIEKPTPADDEVLVKVQAASVNPLDWHYMRGSPYFMRLGVGLGAPTRTRMGVDFSGTVEAVGKNVKLFKPGDEVFGGGAGAFAEYLTIREDRGLAMKPQWCFWRRRHVCGANSKVTWCRSDWCMQYTKPGNGPLNRRRLRR